MDKLTVINNASLAVTPAVQDLINAIQAEFDKGNQTAQKAIRDTYWRVGKRIKTDLLQNAKRAEYGDNLFKVLSQNLKIDQSTLHRSVKFFEEYPQIVATSPQLTWSHITTLLPIEDKKLRQKYEDKIIKENLSIQDLKELIKNDKSMSAGSSEKPILAVERGKPWVYQLKEVQGKIMVDLGFRVSVEATVPALEKETIVQVEYQNKKYKFKPVSDAINPHYTYQAYFLEAIDGDTIWVNIDLGFNTWITQRLRFRGINAQDLEDQTGQAAKKFIEAKLKPCKFIAVRTYWRDKYTRYLADIFYHKQEDDLIHLTQEGKFLNQELLDKGLAVIYQ